jgi:hypothetical protein
MDDFLNAVHEARQEYLDDYRPQLERLAKERDAKRESSKKEQLARLMKDMKVGGKGAAKTAKSATPSTEDLSQPIDETYEGDGQIIEPVSEHQPPQPRAHVPAQNLQERSGHQFGARGRAQDGMVVKHAPMLRSQIGFMLVQRVVRHKPLVRSGTCTACPVSPR